MNFFEIQLENAYIDCKEEIMMGDFNVDLLSQEENFVSWLEVMNLLNLKQIIEKPTRITPCTASLIDHTYGSNPEKVRAVEVSKISISDHFPTSFVYKASFGNKQCHFVTKFRSFMNFNEALFLNDLKPVPWSILDIYADPSDALDVWYSLFLDVAKLHAPFRNKWVKKKQPDWMSQRDHFKSISDNCNYKRWRNKCVSLIR